MAETVFCMFDRLVALNACNSLALIVAIILEALIFISTFALLVHATSDSSLHEIYGILNYVNVLN